MEEIVEEKPQGEEEGQREQGSLSAVNHKKMFQDRIKQVEAKAEAP